MWQQINFVPHHETRERTKEYISALNSAYTNGRVLFFAFKFPNHPVFDWYASRNQFHEMGLFEKFWKKPEVQETIPYKLRDVNFYSLEVFKGNSPFMLAGSLAWCLADGGAYGSNLKPALEIKSLADRAAEEMIQSDYDNSKLYASCTAWSDFFLGVAWDYSWVLLNQRNRMLQVLMATDTD
jgi:hypothetical protein